MFLAPFAQLLEADARARAGAAVVRRPLRRAARRARARHAPRAARPAAASDRRAAARARARARGAHAAATRALLPRGGLRRGGAVAVLRRAARRHGLRLRARPARSLDASVHDDGRRRRRAPDDSLERRRSAARDLRDAARRRPRALRPRACRASCTARCSPTRRAWACTNRRRGSGRITSGAAPRSGGTTSRSCSAAFPDVLGRPRRAQLPSRHQRRRARCRTASPPTKPPTTCTCSCATSSRSRCSPAISPPTICRRPGTSATGSYLGVSAERPRDGCLQDVHWALGEFGYFPTYTIGNLYAAQLVDAYGASHDLDAELAGGNLSSLRDWLAERTSMRTAPSCRPRR